MLLEVVDISHVYQLFLQSRYDSVLRLMTEYEKNTHTVSDVFTMIISIIKSTTLQVYGLFLHPLTVSQQEEWNHPFDVSLDQYLSMTRDGISLATFGHDNHQMLYDSTKTNVHVLFRYLPDTLKTFTPYLKETEKHTAPQACSLFQGWLTKVQKSMAEYGPRLLQSVQTGQAFLDLLHTIRPLLEFGNVNSLDRADVWERVFVRRDRIISDGNRFVIV